MRAYDPATRHVLAVGLAVGVALVAEVAVLALVAYPPLWAMAAPVAWLWAALYALHRHYPPGPTLGEVLAAQRGRTGRPGGILLDRYQVPPGHDHLGPGRPCPACAAEVQRLVALTAFLRAAVELGERLASPAEVKAAGLGAPGCGATLGEHECWDRGEHGSHTCACGINWGVMSGQ